MSIGMPRQRIRSISIMNAPRIGARSRSMRGRIALNSRITIRQSLDAVVLQQGDLFRRVIGLRVGERAHVLFVGLVHPGDAVALAGLRSELGPGCLPSSPRAHLGVVQHHVLGIEIDRRQRERPVHMQKTSRLGREREADREIRIAALPRRPRRIRCREAVLGLAAVLVDLDRADADGRAGRLALSLLRVELAVDEDDAIADDLPIVAHLSLPLVQHVPDFVIEAGDDPVLRTRC